MSTLSPYVRGSLVAAVLASNSVAAFAAEDGDPAFFRGLRFRTDAVAPRNGAAGGLFDSPTAGRPTISRVTA